MVFYRHKRASPNLFSYLGLRWFRWLLGPKILKKRIPAKRFVLRESFNIACVCLLEASCFLSSRSFYASIPKAYLRTQKDNAFFTHAKGVCSQTLLSSVCSSISDTTKNPNTESKSAGRDISEGYGTPVFICSPFINFAYL